MFYSHICHSNRVIFMVDYFYFKTKITFLEKINIFFIVVLSHFHIIFLGNSKCGLNFSPFLDYFPIFLTFGILTLAFFSIFSVISNIIFILHNKDIVPPFVLKFIFILIPIHYHFTFIHRLRYVVQFFPWPKDIHLL